MKRIFILTLILFNFTTICGQNKTPNTISDWKEKNANKKIYAFIGEKIKIEDYTPPPPKDSYKISPTGDTIKLIKYIKFDYGYKAKYKVLKNIHNELKTDTVEFKVFDHHGIPLFSKYEHVLLFLVEDKGELYHCKYQYFDLYKTVDDKWAGVFDRTKYRDTRIKPIKLNYRDSVSIQLNDYLKKHRYFLYPKKFFEHRENEVIPHYGNYVEDLFLIKKEGILRSRGYFK